MAKASIGASDTRVETVDGLRLFVRFWRPEGTARSVITLVPGMLSVLRDLKMLGGPR